MRRYFLFILLIDILGLSEKEKLLIVIVNTIIDFREQERNLLAMIQEALADMDTYKVIFDRNRKMHTILPR